MIRNRIGLGLSAMLAALAMAAAALAQESGEPRDLPVIGAPVPGGIDYQPAVTEVAHDTHWLSFWVHSTMGVIVVFVTVLLLIVIFRFNAKANPTPARFTHNTKIEIAWTLVPVVILIVIGSFSLPILFKQLEVPTPDLTIKATGNQWYWSYNYPENDVSFDSLILGEDELEAHGYSKDSASSGHRHLRGGPGKQGGPHAGHRRGRHSLMDDPGLRGEDRRGAGAAERNLVPG